MLCSPHALKGTVWHYATSTLQCVRQQIRVAMLSCMSAYGLPAVLMLASGLVGGSVSVNYIGFTAFLFPLALGLVILQRDLSRIEVVLRRGTYALSALLLIALAYGMLSTSVQASTLLVPPSPRSDASDRPGAIPGGGKYWHLFPDGLGFIYTVLVFPVACLERSRVPGLSDASGRGLSS